MFSLRTLLLVVAVAAVFAAAFFTQSYVWVSLVATITVAILLIAIIAALPSRPFVAFAVTGCVYVSLTMTGLLLPIGGVLPTTTLLIAATTDESDIQLETDVRPFMERIWYRHLEFVSDPRNPLYQGHSPQRKEPVFLGHCGFALLFAAIAEVIARRRIAKSAGKV
jgi:hypothetical protein